MNELTSSPLFGIVLCVPATVVMAAYIYKREKKDSREASGEKSL